MGAEWFHIQILPNGEGLLLLQPLRVPAGALQQAAAGEELGQLLLGQ